MLKILVTGGAGYIGSHMVYKLLEEGYKPIVLDNFKYSTEQNLKVIEKKFNTKIDVIKHDLSEGAIHESHLPNDIDAVIHFAALKAVGKSVEKPLECYANNVGGTINLLKWAGDNNIKKFIFSSTAAVYGAVREKPLVEDDPTPATNPYAYSKLFSEQIIKDAGKAFGLNSVILRYFNVAGCLEDGSIGDTQKNVQNLIPSIMLSHLGIRPTSLKIFGTDYPTRDGTGIRDYIHVMDLIDGHLKALKYLDKNSGTFTFNLGTGNGTSVMEIINAFEKVTGEELNYEIVERRSGDVASVTCDPTLANKELNWKANYKVEEMVSSMWKWYKNNFKY